MSSTSRVVQQGAIGSSPMDDEVNGTLIRDLATGDFLDQQRNLVLVAGTDTGETHLAVSIAETGSEGWRFKNRA